MNRSAGIPRAAGVLAAGLLLGAVPFCFRSPSRAAAAETPPPVLYFDHARVEDGFRKGGVLFHDPQRSYQVHTSRREGPGEAELHTRDTDIFYIREGSATFVTGGRMVEPRSLAPDEVRGRSVAGGEAHRLMPGDVIIVPRGTPHWFREVSGPLTYFTVKAR